MSLIVYTIAIQFFKLIFKKIRPIKQNIKLDWPIYLCFSQKTPKAYAARKKKNLLLEKETTFLFSLIQVTLLLSRSSLSFQLADLLSLFIVI